MKQGGEEYRPRSSSSSRLLGMPSPYRSRGMTCARISFAQSLHSVVEMAPFLDLSDIARADREVAEMLTGISVSSVVSEDLVERGDNFVLINVLEIHLVEAFTVKASAQE